MGRGPSKLPKESTEAKKALEIAEQVHFAIDQLVRFNSARETRQALTDRWGLSERTACRRVRQAREAMRDDVNVADRQEIIATMTEQCLRVAKEATETRQLSNAIGALRLYGELLGACGSSRMQ